MYAKRNFGLGCRLPGFSFLLIAFLSACAPSPTPIPPTTAPTVASATATIANATLSPVQVVWKSTQENKPLNEPSGLTFDKQGNLYVLDTGYPRVVKYKSTGEFAALFSFSIGSGDGQFILSQDGGGIAVDDQNNLYLTDGRNSRVQKFDSAGKFIMAFGSTGTDEGQFNFPISIAIDSQGNLLVLDYKDARIQKLDRTGKFIAQYGGKGFLRGQFASPAGIALDSGDSMYIADSGSGHVQKLDHTGKYLAEWLDCGPHSLGRPVNIAIDKQDNMYVVDTDNHRICKYGRAGQYLTDWGGRVGSANGEFKYPSAIAVDDAGYVFVAEWGNKRVQKFQQR